MMLRAKASWISKKSPFVGQSVDQLLHVVGLVGTIRDQGVEAVFDAGRVVMEGTKRRFFAVVERQEIEEQANLFQRLDVVFIGAIGNRRLLRVGRRAASSSP